MAEWKINDFLHIFSKDFKIFNDFTLSVENQMKRWMYYVVQFVTICTI